MRPSASRQVVAFGAGAFTLLLFSSNICANIGPRWWGHLAAEPNGVRGVAIFNEHLTIDLRPLAREQPGEVEVIYRVQNSGLA
jgi:hypothetical protein